MVFLILLFSSFFIQITYYKELVINRTKPTHFNKITNNYNFLRYHDHSLLLIKFTEK